MTFVFNSLGGCRVLCRHFCASPGRLNGHETRIYQAALPYIRRILGFLNSTAWAGDCQIGLSQEFWGYYVQAVDLLRFIFSLWAIAGFNGTR